MSRLPHQQRHGRRRAWRSRRHLARRAPAEPMPQGPRVVQRVGPGGEVHEAPAKLSAEAPGGSTAAVEECVVCLDVPRSHAMVPCGHLCVCENCAEEIRGFRSPACPLCRKEAANVIRVFW